jgi:putative phosphoesterase
MGRLTPLLVFVLFFRAVARYPRAMSTLVGIISDTHEDVRMIMKAVKVFKERGPSLIIHCGDIISPPVLELFAGLPLRLVFGNNDGERSGLKKKCGELGFQEIEDTLTFEYAGQRFFVNHGTSARAIEEAVATQSYDYVLHGHTHIPRDEVVGRTRIVNPGALFAADTYTIAFLQPETGQVEFVEIPE